jgi:hypothetical protein
MPDVSMRFAAHHRCMLMTGSGTIDAQVAFDRAARGRRRAALARRLRRAPADSLRLCIYDGQRLSTRAMRRARGIREIPLAAISGTLEPSRARLFDRSFRPAAGARARWERLWLAEHRGAPLPPISVIQVGDSYVVRDGHHRVSVALARGALTIDAEVDALSES